MKYLALALMCIPINVTASEKSPVKRTYTKKKRSTPCPMCGIVFAAKFNLNRHIRVNHAQGEFHHCLSCEYETQDISNLRKHVRRNHPATIDQYFDKNKRKRKNNKLKKQASPSLLQQSAELDERAIAASLLKELSVEVKASSPRTADTPVVQDHLGLSPMAISPRSPLTFCSPLSSRDLAVVLDDWPIDTFRVKQEQ